MKAENARTSPRVFVAWAASVGAAIPIFWFVAYFAFLRDPPVPIPSLLYTALLAVWPSSILLIADPNDENAAVQIISVVVNATLYGVLGWLVWVGLYKSRIVLVAAVLLILIGWYQLYRL